MKTKEKSEKAWKVKADEFDSNLTTTKSVMTEAYLEGISDYKKSLREAIEKRLKIYEEALVYETKGTICYRSVQQLVNELDNVLELLDKVTPPTK